MVSSSRSWGRPGQGSPRCSASSACWTTPGPANTGFSTRPSTPCRLKKRVELNKKYIGFVFQKYHLIDDLTVYENLEIPLSYRDIKPKERAAIVAETLDRFQIVGKKDLYPASSRAGSSSSWVWRGR